MKLQHLWLRSNIPYTTLEPLNEIRCLESTDSAHNKKSHLKVISLICRIKGAQNITPKHTHTQSKKQTNLTKGYTLCPVNTEDTFKYNIALMTSTCSIYIPDPLGTIIKWCHMKHRLQHPNGGRKVKPMKKEIQNNQILTLYHNAWYLLEKLRLH